VNRTELEKAVMVALEKENSKAMEDLRYQIGIHFIRNREISAQEACAILMSLPFVYASGTVEYLDSNQPDRRVEVMRSFKPDDINAKVKLPSKLDKYRSRPLMPEFENLSMMEFHSKFDLISKTDAEAAKKELEETVKDENATKEVLEEKTQAATQKMMAVGEKIYSQTSSQTTPETADSNAQNSEPEADAKTENVQDAEAKPKAE